MKNSFSKIVFTGALILFIVPQVTFAAWWNPFAWGIFHKTDKNTELLEKRIHELESKLSSSDKITTTSTQKVIAATSTSVLKKEVKKVVPTVDSSAVIQEQLRVGVKAELKAKEDQDALIAKQKADEQERLYDIKAEADRQNEAVIAAHEAAEQRAVQDAFQVKQQKLNEINKKIADLNAKYAKDIAAARGSSGVTLEQSDAVVRALNSRYSIDYNILMAEFQQVQYSN